MLDVKKKEVDAKSLTDLTSKEKERAILVGVISGAVSRWDTEEHLDELALLTDTAGAVVVDRLVQERERIDAAYFVGRGKAMKLQEEAERLNADVVIFDDDLSPAQVRNLEKLTGRKILDRSGLILDIFARRAKTREAKTQVELAQLNYLLPRLTRQWTHLSRQVGGIGTRGPGETQLEVDRRLVRKRISTLKRDLQKITSQREVRRHGRQTIFKIALVGYTNAGKSTLLNALTNSAVFVENRLFATLDPTVRRVDFSSDFQALLIDTVGFIRKLPHHLVASFKSTLEEVSQADLLLHVVDITHAHLFEHIGVVKEVLNDLHVAEKPVIYVFNKIDALETKALMNQLKREYEPAVFVSATKQLLLGDLRQAIEASYKDSVVEFRVTLDMKCTDILSRLYTLAEISDSRYEENVVIMEGKTTSENAHIIEYLLNVKSNSEMNTFEFSANGHNHRQGEADA